MLEHKHRVIHKNELNAPTYAPSPISQVSLIDAPSCLSTQAPKISLIASFKAPLSFLGIEQTKKYYW